MATVPINLGYGQVLIYGAGLATGVMGVTPETNRFRFGNIYQIYDGGETFFKVGDSVMFDADQIEVKLEYLNYYYTLIDQSRLAISENVFLP
jgi:hypothetical protein